MASNTRTRRREHGRSTCACRARTRLRRSLSRARPRKRKTSSGGSSSWVSRTPSRSPGRPGAATTAAAPRSRSAGPGSRLSAAAPNDRHGRAGRPRPPRSSAVPLVAVGAWKRFGAAAALAGVDLRVDAGSIVGVVGPNGSGKTTLLRAAAGLLALDAGSLRVGGAAAGSPAARVATALVPDEPTGFDELTLRELVSLVHALWQADERAAARADLISAAFGLDEPPRSPPRHALPRAPPPGERRCGVLARTASRPRRRGHGDARPRSGHRARRGGCCPRCARMWRSARDPGPAFRGAGVPRGRAAPPRRGARTRRAGCAVCAPRCRIPRGRLALSPW